MKKQFRRLISAALAGMMVIGSLTLSAKADGNECAYTDGTTPSYSYTVTGENVNTVTADITFAPALEDDSFAFNDWCGYGVVVNHVNGNKSYYQFGGKEVSWGWDADGDGKEDSFGCNGNTWLGSADAEALTAKLGIPAETGATIDFIVTSWDSYAGTQFTVNITEGGDATVSGAVAYNGGNASSISHTVTADCNSVIIDIEYFAAVGDSFAYNDWCSNGIKVTHADGTASYYVWGGAQVSWGWDADGDGNDDCVDGINGNNWAGTVDSTTLIGSLIIEAAKDDVIEIFALGWDSYAGPQFIVRSFTESGVVVGQTATATLSLNNGDWSDTGAVINETEVKGNGTYTVSAELPAALGSGQFECLTLINGENVFGPTYTVTIDKIVLNGEEIELQGTSYTSSADGGAVDTRVNLYNEWNTPDFEGVNGAGYIDNRTAGDQATATAKLLTAEQVAALQTIEVTFTVAGAFENMNTGEAEIALEPVNLDGKYNAYIGIQTPAYSFRNTWYDSYGLDYTDDTGIDYFHQITGWDADSNAVTKPGVINDAVIEGNGTYTVSITGMDLTGDFETQDYMNQIYVDTDIPNTGEIVISDMALTIDGKSVSINPVISPDSKEYLTMLIQNIWNDDVKTIGAYTVPFETIEITFTVSGFNYDKAAEATAETTVSATAEPVVDSLTTEESAGVPVWVWVVIAVVVVCGAAIAVTLIKKKGSKKED